MKVCFNTTLLLLQQDKPGQTKNQRLGLLGVGREWGLQGKSRSWKLERMDLYTERGDPVLLTWSKSCWSHQLAGTPRWSFWWVSETSVVEHKCEKMITIVRYGEPFQGGGGNVAQPPLEKASGERGWWAGPTPTDRFSHGESGPHCT